MIFNNIYLKFNHKLRHNKKKVNYCIIIYLFEEKEEDWITGIIELIINYFINYNMYPYHKNVNNDPL